MMDMGPMQRDALPIGIESHALCEEVEENSGIEPSGDPDEEWARGELRRPL
jgi:hypothetical protein